MYDTNISFHSSRKYPSIVKSGSTSFSKSSSPITVNLTSITANQTYFVFIEMGGRRFLLAESGNTLLRGTPFVTSNTLRAYLSGSTTGSGTIYWRVYGD